ncbi:MAG: hypothetical protein ACKOOL_05580 [Novosphingobium sp.]
MSSSDFLLTLSVERRLALSYAPSTSRALWLGLFALDARLEKIVRDAREPMLAQIKLAWWREELAKPAAQRRGGEPLLELLAPWGDRANGLAGLAESLEPLLGGELLDRQAASDAANGRAAACLALAEIAGAPTAGVAEAARGWAMADLLRMTADPAPHDWPRITLAREMRPLVVLYGLARRRSGQGPLLPGPLAALAAVRLGLLGV